jgi:hypothetical protein
VNNLLAWQENVKAGSSVYTDVLAKVCAGKHTDTQVCLHLADDLDGMVDSEV